MVAVYDFASARPPVATLKAHGGVAVCRYVKRFLPNAMDLTRAELDGYLAAGLSVLLNAEQSAGDFLTQTTAWWYGYGQYVAARLQSFGVPTDQGVAVPASCDCNVSTSQLGTVVRNYEAFKQGLGGKYGVRVYGPVNVIYAVINAGIAPKGSRHWVAGAASWSGYRSWQSMHDSLVNDPAVGLIQQVGSDIPGTDRNVIVSLNGLGLYSPAGTDPLGTGTPITEGAFMALSDAAQAQLVQDVADTKAGVAALGRLLGDQGATTGKIDTLLQDTTDIRSGVIGLGVGVFGDGTNPGLLQLVRAAQPTGSDGCTPDPVDLTPVTAELQALTAKVDALAGTLGTTPAGVLAALKEALS